MPRSHKEEITPQATQIWDSFQKDMIPYLLSLLPDELFSEGREPELFLQMNKSMYEKYVADGAPIPRDIQYRKQLDVCSLMPVFKKLRNMDELLQMVFDPSKPGPSSATLSVSPTSGQVVTLADAPGFRAELRKQRRKVVATNGCFDLLHVGHLRYLTEAKAFGDFLWVGLNGDASVRDLKGPGRPLVPEADRAELLVAWRIVDAVTIFPDMRATAFLHASRPDIYVKGGDYTVESLNPEEAAALQACGSKVEIVNLVPGKSTTKLVEKMAENKKLALGSDKP
jgi:rfaE bifunctional protein nucleotidyltransferase chain/domain